MKKFSRINLSGNEQYLEVLRALEDRTEYIEIRHNNGEVSETFSDYLEENKDKPECIRTLKRLKEIKNNLNAEVLDFAFENLQLIKRDYDDNTYIFKSNKIYFEFLRKFESFFINEPFYDEYGDLSFEPKFTDFGVDEIIFLDICNNQLFISKTTDGTAKIRDDLEVDRNIIQTIKPKFYDLNLTSNEQYLELLRAVEGRTKYIELVQVWGYDEKDQVVNFALDNLTLLEKENVSEWEGTISGDDRAVRYKFETDKVFFEFLRKFESFYINKVSKSTFTTLTTDFGTDDISFLDERNKRLFSSTTHEGYGLASGELDLDMNIMEEFGD